MIDYKKLYGVSKVKGETTFISYLKRGVDQLTTLTLVRGV